MMKNKTKKSRRGGVLVVFALILPVIMGFGALAIDIGYLCFTRSSLQTGADAAALACAANLSDSHSELITIAEQSANLNTAPDSNLQVSVESGFWDADLEQFHTSPPGVDAVKVSIVQQNVRFFFAGFLGHKSTNISVTATAAVFEEDPQQGAPIGAMALDQRAIPGVRMVGQGLLSSNGTVVVNSRGAGVDENGDWVDHGWGGPAGTTSGQGEIAVDSLLVHGGVASLGNISNYTPGGPHPLKANHPILPDPLADLPIPGAEVPEGYWGVDLTYQGSVKANGKKAYNLSPGIYDSIMITGGYITFEPGMYIIMDELKITKARSVRGLGVTFYLTGDTYATGPNYGYYDALDGPVDLIEGTDQIPPPPSGEGEVSYASAEFEITGADAILEAPHDTLGQNPYAGILFFQRRRNTKEVKITGGGGADIHMWGVLYAKWAEFRMAGGGVYEGSFVSGTINLAGHSNVDIIIGEDSLIVPTEPAKVIIALVQ